MSENRVLRLAAIAAFILGAILVAIGIYEYLKGGGLPRRLVQVWGLW